MNDLPLPWFLNHWQHLRSLIDKDRLPHALLLSGPPGIGKLQFADFFVRSLLCETATQDGVPCGVCRGCVQHSAGSHPDCLVASPDPRLRPAFAAYPSQQCQVEAMSRPGRQRLIKIDQVREIAGRLTEFSNYRGFRVVVVEPAEALTFAAANALLKNLEEPRPGICFILVSHAPGRLPATVRSRCRWLRCEIPQPRVAMQWLGESAPAADRERALLLCQGAPLRAKRSLEMGSENLQSRLIDVMGRTQPPPDPVHAAGEIGQLETDQVLAELASVLAILARLSVTRDRRTDSTLERLRAWVERLDLRELLRLYDWVIELRRFDAVQLNARLLLEQFLIRWYSLATMKRQ